MSKLLEGNQEINGATIHYYYSVKRGTVPFVLVHGIAVSSRYMLPLANELAKTNTVYALDLPGFGKSSELSRPLSIDSLADALGSFIEILETPKPVIVANSFGCQVSLKLIKDGRVRVSKAVLVGPTMNIYERSSVKQILRWLQNLRHEPTMKMSYLLMKDIWDCGLFRAFKTLKVGVKDRPEESMRNLNVPILFLRGSRDPIAPPEWLSFLVKQNKIFKSGEIPLAGHAVNFNSPRPLAKIIRNFLINV